MELGGAGSIFLQYSFLINLQGAVLSKQDSEHVYNIKNPNFKKISQCSFLEIKVNWTWKFLLFWFCKICSKVRQGFQMIHKIFYLHTNLNHMLKHKHLKLSEYSRECKIGKSHFFRSRYDVATQIFFWKRFQDVVKQKSSKHRKKDVFKASQIWRFQDVVN